MYRLGSIPAKYEADKWIVGRTFDTVSMASHDSLDQSVCFGASFDVDSEHETEEQAFQRCAQIKGTMPKRGYEII